MSWLQTWFPMRMQVFVKDTTGWPKACRERLGLTQCTRRSWQIEDPRASQRYATAWPRSMASGTESLRAPSQSPDRLSAWSMQYYWVTAAMRISTE